MLAISSAVAVCFFLTFGSVQAAPTNHDQVVLFQSDTGTAQDRIVLSHRKPHPNVPEALDSEDHVLKVNMTFDGINLTETIRQPLESYHYLSFDQYEVLNAEAAVSNGSLDARDKNCAVTQPNAIHGIKQPMPAILRSNATALAAENLSEFFDFVSFAIKPLVSKSDFVWVYLNAWTIVDQDAKDVKSLILGFFGDEDGSFDPFLIQPGGFSEGWGLGANFIELYMEDEDGNPAEFCIDNMIIEFYEL